MNSTPPSVSSGRSTPSSGSRDVAVLLDTSAYSAAMRGHADLQEALRASDDVRVNAVVVGELRAGFARGQRRRRNETLLSSFLGSPSVTVHSLDGDTADCYAAILHALFVAGTPITTNDVWIAATAMQYGLRLLTTDRDFLHVSQVRVELFETR